MSSAIMDPVSTHPPPPVYRNPSLLHHLSMLSYLLTTDRSVQLTSLHLHPSMGDESPHV